MLVVARGCCLNCLFVYLFGFGLCLVRPLFVGVVICVGYFAGVAWMLWWAV